MTAVTQPLVKDGLAFAQGTLTASSDSQAAFDTVQRLRTRTHAIAGADAKVGGGSAVNLDIQRASRHDRDLVVPIVQFLTQAGLFFAIPLYLSRGSRRRSARGGPGERRGTGQRANHPPG